MTPAPGPDSRERVWGVAAFAFDSNDRLLVVRHRQRGWEVPGGKLEPGETPEGALAREVAEEAGVATEAAVRFASRRTRHRSPGANHNSAAWEHLIFFIAQLPTHPPSTPPSATHDAAALVDPATVPGHWIAGEPDRTLLDAVLAERRPPLRPR